MKTFDPIYSSTWLSAGGLPCKYHLCKQSWLTNRNANFNATRLCWSCFDGGVVEQVQAQYAISEEDMARVAQWVAQSKTNFLRK